MQQTTKAKVSALAVLALALLSAPASMIANAPEAKATRSIIRVAEEPALPSVPPPPVLEETVEELPEVVVKPSPRKAPKASPVSEPGKWVCRTRVLEQGGRPGHQTVKYCDWQ